MALSLGWHIVIACFGVGFPLIVLLAEWRALRTGDPVYIALAKAWTKALGVLFAVGAVSGTILSFELGILWPRFMGRFGEVIGLPFAMEGIAFFVEAIFVGLYLYGWDRLSPRVHLLTGVPDRDGRGGLGLVRGDRQRLDEPAHRVPARPVRRGGRPRSLGGDAQPGHAGADDPHDPGRLHGGRLRRGGGLRRRLAAGPARPLPPAGVPRAVHAGGGGHAGPDRCRRLGGPLPGRASAGEAGRPRGPPRDAAGRARSPSAGVYVDGRVHVGVRGAEGPVAPGPPRPRRPGARARRGPARRPAAGGGRPERLPGHGGASAWACWPSALWFAVAWWRRRDLPPSTWFHRAAVAAGVRRPDRPRGRLDRDRGRAPALDRLRG